MRCFLKKSFIVFRFFLKSLFWKICFFFFFEIRTKNPTKWHLQPTMFVPISFSDNLFVLRKISVPPAFREKCILSSPSCVSYRSKKVFLKNLIRKNCFLEENKTSFISSWVFAPSFFLRRETLFYFSIVLLIFCVCVFLFFLFLFGFFSGVFHLFFEFVQTKIFKKNLSRIYRFSKKKLSFELFWEEGTYFWCKKNVQK